MSRGLGKLQSAILDALRKRKGGDYVVDGKGYDWRVPDGFHSLNTLRCELDNLPHQSAFYRAVRKLVDRGLIEIPEVVPCAIIPVDFCAYGKRSRESWSPDSWLDRFSQGRAYSQRRSRFVCLTAVQGLSVIRNFITLKPTTGGSATPGRGEKENHAS
jgi:hypothetical protein